MLGVTPPPAGARFHGHLPKLGAPVHIAEYADGVHICAYPEPPDPSIGSNGGRRYLPWQWGPERQDYVQRALPNQPRPLYRARNLELHPDCPVFVFEREDMVDAFHTLSGDAEVIATTIPGGISAFELGEWAELNGRRVVFWPTHAPECEQAMQHVGRTLDKAGSKVQFLTIPQDRPKGWSFLDVVAAEWSWESVERFVREQLRAVDKQLQPIGPAHLGRGNGAAAPILEQSVEKQVRQPPVQVLSARDVWSRMPQLDLAPSGTPYPNVSNVILALQQFQGRYADVWYDEFHCQVRTDSQHPRAWRDNDSVALCATIQRELKIAGVRTPIVREAVEHIAYQNPRHEVREWLKGLHWDGTFRLALMLPHGFGTAATPYCTSVGRCFLVAAVARVMRPGCQVDYVPVFEGPGGRGKTSALRILGGQWFDNPSAQMGEKDFLQNMAGKWILELAELANIRRHELEVIKAIITRTVDTYRVPYGRMPEQHARQCVFAGSIDRNDWNTDEAGGRRWWPVACGKIDLDWLATNREQLFAEAFHRYEEGEPWYDVSERDAQEAQKARRSFHAWTPRIARWLEGKTSVSVEDILMFPLSMELPEKWTDTHQKTVRRILRELGWSEQADRSWAPP